MKKRQETNVKNLSLHTAAWVVVLIITLVNTDDMSFNTWQLKFNLPMWFCYLIIFYVNYLVFIPRLMIKRRTVTYMLCSILLLAGVFTVQKLYMQYWRKADLSQRLEHISNSSAEHMFGRKREELIHRIEHEIERCYNIKQYNPVSRQNQPVIYRMLLVYAISLMLGLTKRWKFEEQRRKEIEREHIASELDYLKAQINPHFLFNALNSIYSLTIPYSETASNAVLKLSSILRYMLYETDHTSVSLSDEISVIENYLGLQQLRLTDKTRLTFVKEGATERYRIEPLLLIPLIENAFKYGIDSSEPSYIDIKLDINDGRLVMEVRNRIVNIKKRDDNTGGLGIRNIKRRLELLYPDRHTLKAEERNGDFFVYLSIPLSKDDQTPDHEMFSRR